ncbi:MAG: MtnX-like HAD-IB family phosphatase [Terriglobia bacterium]
MTASQTPHPIVFSDFDGTITLADVTDEILTRLADPAWRDIERQWIAGSIGSHECLERQLALVKTSAKDLNALIDSIPIDPGFLEFVRFVQRTGVPFVVLSDGLDYVIRRILAHFGVHSRGRNGVHFYSSSATLVRGRLAVSFPHAVAACTHGCATCKPYIMRRLIPGNWPVVYIGDGRSDRHAVAEADIVYARPALAEICRQQRIPCKEFKTFAGIELDLAERFGGERAEGFAARSGAAPILAE